MGSWQIAYDLLPQLLIGLRYATIITFASFFLSMALGLAVVLARLSSLKVLSGAAFVYQQVFRSLSPYVYILLVYFGIAAFFRLNISPVISAVISLTLLNSAYMSEIYRGALSSVESGQREAALSIGLTKAQAFYDIIWPQAFRVAVPALINQLIAIFKDASIVGVIGVNDMMYIAHKQATITFKHFELYTTVAVIYVVIVIIMSNFSSMLERKIRIPT